MADQPGQGPKDAGQETIFNSGIGNDWGEAFEAEDFMAAPKADVSDEFFLPDEATEANINIPAGDVDRPGQVEEAPSSLGRLVGYRQYLLARLRAFPLSYRIAAAALPIFALILFFALHNRPVPTVPGTETKPEASVVHQAEPAIAPHEPGPEVTSPGAHAVTEGVVEKPKPITPEVKIPRKKWNFQDIIVHSKSEGEGSAIVTTDLTLVLKLAPGATPPLDKGPFIREILYQFYVNQPLADLKRYALERGEMKSKLQAWIAKQCPELPLDSIAIDRYQLL